MTDVTVYGATGMTGKHIARYLLSASQTEKKALKIALAGRNKAKLESRRDMLLSELTTTSDKTSHPASLSVVVADSQDLSALTTMAKNTKVVICCAGPFHKYATLVVQACAETGTDYVDITGEAFWVGAMRQKYGATAQKTGARIISLCGFDSVPSDLSVFGAVQALRKVRGNDVPIQKATTYHVALGMANGGTLASMATIPIDYAHIFLSDKGTPRKVPLFGDDPLILSHPTNVRFHQDYTALKERFALDEWRNQLPNLERMMGWAVSIPFFMGIINAKVVQSSSVALQYGPDFTYQERHLPLGWSLTKNLGILSAIPALMVQLGGQLLFLVIRLPIIGAFLLNTFAPPGSGTSDDFCAQCSSQVYADVAAPAAAPSKTGNVDRVTCFMAFQGDAGNMVTAQCVCESALSLLWDKADLPPKTQDGFGTPAELLGNVLFQRLVNNQVRKVDVYTKVVKDDVSVAKTIRMYG